MARLLVDDDLCTHPRRGWRRLVLAPAGSGDAQPGHAVVAVALPFDDDSASLAQYAGVVIDAVGDRTQLILVAHSLAGSTAPLVYARRPADLLVLLTAMVAAPGETPGHWWANTNLGASRAQPAARDGRALDARQSQSSPPHH